MFIKLFLLFLTLSPSRLVSGPAPTCLLLRGIQAGSCPDTLILSGQRCLCLFVSVWVLWRNMGVCHGLHVTSLSLSLCFLPSSLQVLSHNLYTVLNIPHDPVALEEHFQDDDDGPVSNHGYMPYLNKYILNKVATFYFDRYSAATLCFQSGLCNVYSLFLKLLII